MRFWLFASGVIVGVVATLALRGAMEHSSKPTHGIAKAPSALPGGPDTIDFGAVIPLAAEVAQTGGPARLVDINADRVRPNGTIAVKEGGTRALFRFTSDVQSGWGTYEMEVLLDRDGLHYGEPPLVSPLATARAPKCSPKDVVAAAAQSLQGEPTVAHLRYPYRPGQWSVFFEGQPLERAWAVDDDSCTSCTLHTLP